ncbi:MAG TPA: alpha-glucan family phosphorylase [Bacillota bacterium]|nr:alpha-glucan family phosphorylase [Bacillota bacterium]
MFPYRVVSVTPKLPGPISRLRELAYDFWFSWKPGNVEFFRSISPELWRQAGHNPVRFLMRVREGDLVAASQDEDYLVLYRRVFELYDQYMSEETWFEKQYPMYKDDITAYFSAEFGLHESHPIYSGGLGLLAGDHCKSASDLGLPFVGVGLLYKHGYFEQKINAEGRQEAEYPYLNFFELPITPVHNPDGGHLAVPVELPGRNVFVQVWKAGVGKTNLYLLDADCPNNAMEDRHLTGSLYGGDRQTRLAQEMLLGIGGVRALRAMGIKPRAWHINEGHASFLIVERIRELVREGLPFDTAREAVRASTIFTTHTPVPAGHDLFDGETVERFFAPVIAELGIDAETFKELGWDDGRNSFNMTILALRHSFLANGVSRLHGKVSREMFRRHYPGLHIEEIPVTSVTNGVHTESWMSWELRDLFYRYLRKELAAQRSRDGRAGIWERVEQIPDEELWKVHRFLKERMIEFVRRSLRQQRKRNHEPAERILEVDGYLDPDILTIGFARRFATYKRAGLLFRDPERLARLINDPDRPVRFIFAGKAHPADLAGQELLRTIYEFSNSPEFRGKVLLVENYDIHVARHLLQGADAWLSTPRRPMEASGTSGMKAAINGLINISTLDGWWAEAYDGRNGFAVGSGGEYADEEQQDRDDWYSLFSVLEEQVVPMYYRREDGIPREWLKTVKYSIKTIAPVFNTDRMVAEYTERCYIPAIRRGIEFAVDNYQAAARAAGFKKFAAQNWDKVSFVSVTSNGRPKMLVGDRLEVAAEVDLGPFGPESVSVEIVCGDAGDSGLKNIAVVPMTLEGKAGRSIFRYRGSVVLQQGAMGYTVRVRPDSRDFPHYELPLAVWANG